MAKRCAQCGETKELTEFSNTKGTYLHSYCKPCHSLNGLRLATRRRESLHTYKKEHGCAFCGIKICSVLEVHHLATRPNGKTHTTTANTMLNDLIKGTAILLCANHHLMYHSHFGGRHAPFPSSTIEEVMTILNLRKDG